MRTTFSHTEIFWERFVTMLSMPNSHAAVLVLRCILQIPRSLSSIIQRPFKVRSLRLLDPRFLIAIRKSPIINSLLVLGPFLDRSVKAQAHHSAGTPTDVILSWNSMYHMHCMMRSEYATSHDCRRVDPLLNGNYMRATTYYFACA